MKYFITTISVLAFAITASMVSPQFNNKTDYMDIDSMFEVDVVKKNLVKDYMREDMYMIFRFRNVSPNVITVFEGDLTFSSMSGAELKKVAVLHDDPIKPGEVVDIKYMLDHNDFLEQDITLATMPLGDIDASWDTRSVTLKNGEELTDE